MSSTQPINRFVIRLRDLAREPSFLDFRDVVEDASPNDVDDLEAVIREYGALRRAHAEMTDFEEFRRAVPWVFESESLLAAAVETVIENALLLGQDYAGVARSLARAHPLARNAVARALGRWTDRNGAPRLSTEVRALPHAFGPEGLDGAPRFRLLAQVGAGPSGVVYESVDLDQLAAATCTVAVKILRPGHLRPDWGQSLQHLADMRTIPADGIARVVDAGLAPSGDAFAAYELVRGEPLTRWRSGQRPRSPRAIVTVLAHLARTVEGLHAAGVTHGWIKPTNVLVTEEGAPVLTDLGLGDVFVELLDKQQAYSADAALAFVPPESFGDAPRFAGPTRDVYWLGGLLYWLLSGDLPNGPSAQNAYLFLLDSVATERRYPPSVPRELRAICERALAPNPRERHRSVTELRYQLESWLANRAIEGVTAPWRRPILGLRRHRLAAVAAAAGMACAVAAAGWSVQRRDARVAETYRLNSELLGADLRGQVEAATRQLAMSREWITSTRDFVSRWTDTIIQTPDTHPALSIALLSAINLSGLADGEQKTALMQHSVVTSRAYADRLTLEGPGTIECALAHLVAGHMMYTEGDADCLRYLERARVELGALVRPDDPWLTELDELIVAARQLVLRIRTGQLPG